MYEDVSKKYKVKVGKVHPAYFDVNVIMKKFAKREVKEGLLLESSVFDLYYSDGYFYADERKVLDDIYRLVKETYGTNATREQAKRKINFSLIDKNVNQVNVGVCLLKDSYYSGWDGSINAIWYDDNPPGEIVDVVYVFWTQKQMFDSHNYDINDIGIYPKQEILKNLILSKTLQKGKNKQLTDESIKNIIKLL